MSDLLHWHKIGDEPSIRAEPAICCIKASEDLWMRRIDAAVHAERKRVILASLAAVEAYGDAAMSVLTKVEDKALVKTVTDKALAAIRANGCICPRMDATSFGEMYATMAGYDSRCGMHEQVN